MSLHYLGKHVPQKLSFQSCYIPCLENEIAIEIIFATVLNNKVLLSTKNYYNWLMSVKDIASQRSVVFETGYTA